MVAGGIFFDYFIYSIFIICIICSAINTTKVVDNATITRLCPMYAKTMATTKPIVAETTLLVE